MVRKTIWALVAIAVLGTASYEAWRYLSQLNANLEELDRKVASLGEDLLAAESRATQAEAEAESARSKALEADRRAELSLESAKTSEEVAQRAELGRMEAENEALQAEASRLKAETQALSDARALEVAEREREVAATERSKALQEAEASRIAAAEARAEAERLERRRNQEIDRLQHALGRIAETRRTALGVVMSLDSNQIEFDFNKAELRPKNRELLARIAGVLMTASHFGLQIYGHTDQIGSDEYNQELSERRAEAVREYLAEAGIDPDVISTMGLGKSEPLVEGSDANSRQRNRRVELALVLSEGTYDEVIQEPESN